MDNELSRLIEREFIVCETPLSKLEAEYAALKAQLAEYAERDRWRVTADEPPTENCRCQVLWNKTTHEMDWYESANEFLNPFMGDEQPTHWRPLRTDKPTPANES